MVKALPSGAVVRIKDVARIDLGAQNYSVQAEFNGKSAAAVAIDQLPGSNVIDTMKAAKALMEQAKQRFPDDIDYTVALDSTAAVTAGFEEILTTLWQAMVLVLLVVFAGPERPTP